MRRDPPQIIAESNVKLQKAQELLHELEGTPCVHGAFLIVRRIVEDRELLRPIMIGGRELLSEDFDRLHNDPILAS